MRVVLWALYALVLALLLFRLWGVWREDAAAAPPPFTGSRMIDTSIGRVHTQMRGPEDGPRVVLVHGTAAWSGFWDDVAIALAADGYRVAAFDLPPFGWSERREPADYDRASQARRIRETIVGLGWTDAVIVGHSFGAGPALEAAFRHPSETRGLVLVCGALALPDDDAKANESGGLIAALAGQGWLMQPVVAAVFTNPLLTRRLLAMMLHRKETATERQADILRGPMIRAGTIRSYAAWLPMLLAPETGAWSHHPKNYPAYAVPTALIWGAEDAVTPLPQGRRLQGLMRGASLDIIPGVGHIPHIEAPEAFLAILKPRLAALSARKP